MSGVTSAGDGKDDQGEVAEVEDEEIKNGVVPRKARQFPITEVSENPRHTVFQVLMNSGGTQ